MKTKTCGDCKYHKSNRCMSPCYVINHSAENSACHRFEPKPPITNGDKVRMMTNEELADFFRQAYNGQMCHCCINKRQLNAGNFTCIAEMKHDRCVKGFLAWLNAPAESEMGMRCVNCRWYHNENGLCLKDGCSVFNPSTDDPCEYVDNMTVFDRITVNEETLAPLLIRVNAYVDTGIFYTSRIVCGSWHNEDEAIAATVKKLKEVEK